MQPPFKAYDGNSDFVFISYASDDNEIIYPILIKLNEQGLRIWYDEGIQDAIDWRKVLYNKIKGCSAFIAFLTKNSVKSTYLYKECLVAAMEFNNRKLPVILAKLENVQTPDGIAFEFISLQEDRSYIFGEDYFINNISRSLDNSLWELSVPSNKMNDIVQIYTVSGEPLGTATRKEIHEKPLWHKTVVIFIIHPSGKLVYVKRSGRSRISPNLFDCFGGHLKENETYLEAAMRELSEELALSLDTIEERDLIQIGDPGQFKGKFVYNDYVNYEFSSLYLYFLNQETVFKTQETFGEDIVPLFYDADFLDDLLKKYKKNKKLFADGISRVLRKGKIVKQIKKLVETHKTS